MEEEPHEQKVRLEEDISVHILTVSAAMVGVCLTVIGLLRVVITMQKQTPRTAATLPAPRD
jgi:hypothetical protein